MNLSPPRGTRDFFPEDMRFRNWLFGHFREVARLFAFEEYDTPVVESVELYTRKAGEDIVEQLYAFEDKSGRNLALRPEITPSLARLVLQKAGSLALPIKWFSIPQCWRYERMTRGRRREHYQWNMDILGVETATAEAELIRAIVTFFSRIGLGPQDVEIRVSNRQILKAVLEDAGVPEDQFGAVCVIIDKLEKLPEDVIKQQLNELGVDQGIVDTIVELGACDSLEAVSKLMEGSRAGLDELEHLFALSASYGCDEWLRFDPSLVRGLAYYTGIVFEAFALQGELRAICGGGRYDHLLSMFGGKDVPACGLGFGDAVIAELLKEKNLLPTLAPFVQDVVFAFDESLREAATQVAARLRDAGRSVDLILENKKLKWAFKHADMAGAQRMVLLAPDEWSKGLVRVRNLETGEENDRAVEDL